MTVIAFPQEFMLSENVNFISINIIQFALFRFWHFIEFKQNYLISDTISNKSSSWVSWYYIRFRVPLHNFDVEIWITFVCKSSPQELPQYTCFCHLIITIPIITSTIAPTADTLFKPMQKFHGRGSTHPLLNQMKRPPLHFWSKLWNRTIPILMIQQNIRWNNNENRENLNNLLRY